MFPMSLDTLDKMLNHLVINFIAENSIVLKQSNNKIILLVINLHSTMVSELLKLPQTHRAYWCRWLWLLCFIFFTRSKLTWKMAHIVLASSWPWFMKSSRCLWSKTCSKKRWVKHIYHGCGEVQCNRYGYCIFRPEHCTALAWASIGIAQVWPREVASWPGPQWWWPVSASLETGQADSLTCHVSKLTVPRSTFHWPDCSGCPDRSSAGTGGPASSTRSSSRPPWHRTESAVGPGPPRARKIKVNLVIMPRLGFTINVRTSIRNIFLFRSLSS